MAARLPDADEQCTQQFVNQLPFVERVQRRGVLPTRLPPVHPEERDEEDVFNKQRQVKAHLPEDAHRTEKWRLALQMIDT